MNCRITYERWSHGACKFRCAVCKFTSECSAEFWKHAAKEHLLNIAEYKTELGNPCVTYKVKNNINTDNSNPFKYNLVDFFQKIFSL
jgi:hypothetical protein